MTDATPPSAAPPPAAPPPAAPPPKSLWRVHRITMGISMVGTLLFGAWSAARFMDTGAWSALAMAIGSAGVALGVGVYLVRLRGA